MKKMKKMKKLCLCAVILIGCFLSQTSFANDEKEAVYLTQIMNQLDAMQPLIMAAQKEQPTNTRIQFHYTSYKDAQGYSRNGLLEDMQAMRKGIEEKLNSITIEPRTISPIKGDYMEKNERNERKEKSDEVNHS